jgi:hypothetical protein
MIPKYNVLWKQVLKTDKEIAHDSLKFQNFIHDMNLYMNYYNKNKKDFLISKQDFFRLFVVYYRYIPVQHGETYGPSKSVFAILARQSKTKIFKTKTRKN